MKISSRKKKRGEEMGFPTTKKVHNKSEDKGIAYILAAKREVERSKRRRKGDGEHDG